MKSLATAAVAGVLLALAGAAQAAPGDTVYARPGEIVSAGDGAQLNFTCMGRGSPAVVFDSGWEDWAPVWAIVQPRVAKWTRACSYDRAGAGFSKAGPMPRTSERIAGELHTALHNAGVAGPYILVGHAFGGDNVRAFADLFMPEVAGLVLVEADPVELMSQERQDRDHKGHADLPVELRACRDAIAGHKPLPPLAKGSTRTCAQQFFRGLPETQWSPATRAADRNATAPVAWSKLFSSWLTQIQCHGPRMRATQPGSARWSRVRSKLFLLWREQASPGGPHSRAMTALF
ncbi:MAG TPA: alpha/beta hydrolase [Rhizomicrobium sp.]|jgi:pimeloyl-ACP methyl ester carboxylesterase|nr:alpha/beta hydrolase [Rhizomicrobium sp.]